jgi:hypothetical protein
MKEKKVGRSDRRERGQNKKGMEQRRDGREKGWKRERKGGRQLIGIEELYSFKHRREKAEGEQRGRGREREGSVTCCELQALLY